MFPEKITDCTESLIAQVAVNPNTIRSRPQPQYNLKSNSEYASFTSKIQLLRVNILFFLSGSLQHFLITYPCLNSVAWFGSGTY